MHHILWEKRRVGRINYHQGSTKKDNVEGDDDDGGDDDCISNEYDDSNLISKGVFFLC